jgi:AcrR family transcriptional regulator
MGHRGYRRDGFTPEKKLAAIEALGKYGTIADACRVAGISKTSFYRHEEKDPAFAESCRIARLKAAVPLDAVAWQRAVEGATERIYRKGELVQERTRPSDALLRLVLQSADPDKYGTASPGAKARMEAALRTRIEAEIRAEGWQKKPGPEELAAMRKEFSERLSAYNRKMGGEG